ncbi:hypothetical protein GCM10027614_20650 [Micromonospora vulcania]
MNTRTSGSTDSRTALNLTTRDNRWRKVARWPATVDVDTSSDGTLVIRRRGLLDADEAVDLRRTVVRAIRHDRPLRLVVDLSHVHGLGPIKGYPPTACATSGPVTTDHRRPD